MTSTPSLCPWRRRTIEKVAAFLENYPLPTDYVVRALGSTEQSARPDTPLDLLAEFIADCLHVPYLPHLLGRTTETPPLHSLDLISRKKTIHRIYYIYDKTIDLNHKKVLIIDDVTTTGATIGEILRAIHHEYPLADVSFFSLARSCYSQSSKQYSSSPVRTTKKY